MQAIAKPIVLTFSLQLLFLSALGNPALEGLPLDQLEIEMAREALRLLKLERTLVDLSYRLADLNAEGFMHSTLEMSSHIARLKVSLANLEDELSSIESSGEDASQRLAEISLELNLLKAENEGLEMEIATHREALELGPIRSASVKNGDATGGGYSDLASSGAERLSFLVLVLSSRLRASVDGVSSLVDGAMEILRASGEEGSGSSTIRSFPTMRIAILVFAAMAIIGVAAMIVQNYHAGRLSRQGITELLSRLGSLLPHSKDMNEEEIASSVHTPFWDPIPESGVDIGRGRRISTVDKEYIQMLNELGYPEEARRLAESLDGRMVPTEDPYDSRRAGVRWPSRFLIGEMRSVASAFTRSGRWMGNALVVLANRSAERRLKARRIYRRRSMDE